MSKLIILVFLFSLSVMAQEFEEPRYNGSGCPEDSVGVSITPDQTSIALLFDSYNVQVPQYDQNNDNGQLRDARTRTTRAMNDPSVEHKACALSLGIKIPTGLQVDSVEVSVDTRGFTSLDQGVQGTFSATLIPYLGASRRAMSVQVIERKLWRTAIDEDWYSNPKIIIPVNSGCSQSAQSLKFDIKTHLNVEILNKDLTKNGLISVDSNDVNGAFKIKLNTSPCRSARTAPVQPNRPR